MARERVHLAAAAIALCVSGAGAQIDIRRVFRTGQTIPGVLDQFGNPLSANILNNQALANDGGIAFIARSNVGDVLLLESGQVSGSPQLSAPFVAGLVIGTEIPGSGGANKKIVDFGHTTPSEGLVAIGNEGRVAAKSCSKKLGLRPTRLS